MAALSPVSQSRGNSVKLLESPPRVAEPRGVTATVSLSLSEPGNGRLDRDLSSRNASDYALAPAVLASAARFRATFEHATIGMAVLGFDGVIIDTNSALQRILGYGPAELRGHPFQDFAPSEDAQSYRRPVADLADELCQTVTVEQRYVRKDGSVVWASVTMSRAPGDDATTDADAVGIVAMIQDVTAQKLLEAKLTHQAFHDPLTNLANRSLFRQRVESAIRRTAGHHRVVVMFLDLDHFKAVNETFGHGRGDQLLIAAAERLLSCTRGSDTVARLGGDEFAILLENVRDEAEMLIVAERITSAMSEPIMIGGDVAVVGVSIGIARHDDDNVDELLRNADVAMYTAKARGRGCHVFFEREMYTAVADRKALESDLRRAIVNREFMLQYQPLVNLSTGRVVGVESLVRWAHPQRGLVPPLDFIPIAEETGLIVQLGRWVLTEACRQTCQWMHETPDVSPVTVTVNISGRQLQDPHFVADVARILRESGLPPSCLVLEITETVIMQRTDAMLQRLRDLKEIGVRLAIDDFGTGYSSLSYLQQFPIDILKIDKAFVDDVGIDGTGAALTRTIIGLGGTLGLTTVAEGIEDAQQHSVLRDLGCELGQGYLFARPLSAIDAGIALQSANKSRHTSHGVKSGRLAFAALLPGIGCCRFISKMVSSSPPRCSRQRSRSSCCTGD